MANPDYVDGALPRRKQPANELEGHDSVLPVQNFGKYNATPPTLADGDVMLPQLDDMGNLKIIIGDPAQLAQIGSPTVATANVTTAISVGTSSTTVLASNSDRIEAIIVNDSDETVYLNLSGTAVMNEGVRLNASGGALALNTYTGIITAICTSGGKNLTVTEL